MNARELELFERKPALNAVLSMIVPTITSQIITVLYNVADTFFIGQMGDPNQIAAANLCMPLFILLTGFSNLFGIGGASLISRSLGKGQNDRARQAASFSIWTACIITAVYGVLVYIVKAGLLPLLGVNDATYTYCCQYLFWTVFIGAVPTVLNTVFAHLIRAEGLAKQASFGMILGTVLNIILDPVFITLFGMEIRGAALATMLSNLIATIYFVALIIKRKDHSVISLHPQYYKWSDRVPSEVLLVGMPSALMSLMSTASNITLNRLMSAYCNEAIAGVGIAKKIDMVAFGVANGISQGVIPLIGYNYSAGNFKRMKNIIHTTFAIALGSSFVFAILLFTCANPMVKAFIDDRLTVEYGQRFQRIFCITGPCIAITLIIMTLFQSIGYKRQPMILSFLRKGGLDIPLMLILNMLARENGVVWAVPAADFSAMVVAILLFIPFWKKISAQIESGA